MSDPRLSTTVSRKTPTLRRRVFAASLSLLLLFAGLAWSQLETLRIAARGYVFGYPLVLADLTRRNFERIAPANRLVHMPTFPDADFREFVRPNVDTLYSQAWLDMDAGPWVFEVPDNQRYLLMQFLDGWSNVIASLGTRTLGTGGGSFLLVGPDWTGEVPDGLTLLRSPTRMTWLLGRIQTNGKADYPAVHAIQAGIQLRSLKDWQRGVTIQALPFTPSDTSVVSPLYQIRAIGAPDFFSHLAALLPDNPAAAVDATAVADLERLGINMDGSAPEWTWLQTQTLRVAVWLANRQMLDSLQRRDGLVNGWRQPPMHIGAYGEDYGLRAVVAMAGFGANLAADAIYPNANLDGEGQWLQGGQHYRLHFAANQLPPAKAFWSVTAYDDDGYLIANAQGRYALGDRDSLRYNADGSLDLWLQSEVPAVEKQSNWLPIPASGPFSLTGRIYLPEQRMLNGQWHMPGIERF